MVRELFQFRFRRLSLTLSLALCFFPFGVSSALSSGSDLTELSLEDLMNLEVYSVAKKPQKMFSTAAAIYVITPDDIRRSGATSIPEVLRMVPGISVQRVNSHAWDISARGFNNSVFANKMLVLIDGRAVYTPLFAGVFWDVQDVVLEDIERIEVIRGPGGALWGANAVNGVINIITKRAEDTQGTLISGGTGTEEKGFVTGRYGGKAKDWYYRTYAKYFERGEGYRASGTANDEWQNARAGFKTQNDAWTVQGDFYNGTVGQRTNIFSFNAPNAYIIDKPVPVLGGNILTKYQDEDWSLQAYWDVTQRDLHVLDEKRNTLDLEYNQKARILPSQELNWGLGYRLQMEDIKSTPMASIASNSRPDQIFSLFLQDEIRMMDERLKFILGGKVEHNIYTEVEAQPNVRLSYDINEKNVLWAAASRAVRTPSRLEEDGEIIGSFSAPSTFNETVGNHDLSSERLDAYELGYRNQPLNNMFVDLAVFYNHYKRIITYIPGQVLSQSGFTINTFEPVNGIEGNVGGVELSSDIEITDWWRIKDAYTFTKMDLITDTDIVDLGLEAVLEDAVPRHSFYMRSSFNLPHQFEFDVALRYSDSFTNGRVPALIQADLNLIKMIKEWEFAIVGQNLFRSHQRESILTTATQTRRGGYVKITRRF